ncbi:MAG: superoxide dismutase family protein [Clostridia bacterium]|nr:superoxide dismutase family protein [Clostridia bacterium]
MYHRTTGNRTGAYSYLICGRRPFARAELKGSYEYPAINGTVDFFATPAGIVVSSEVFNLPYDEEKPCSSQIYGFHIHKVGKCTGGEEPFSDAGEHFDKDDCQHPYHSGDLPPLFGNHGYAWSAVLSDRFSPEDVVGRSVIVHLHADDMHTAPSGNSGRRIACGIIMGV